MSTGTSNVELTIQTNHGLTYTIAVPQKPFRKSSPKVKRKGEKPRDHKIKRAQPATRLP